MKTMNLMIIYEALPPSLTFDFWIKQFSSFSKSECFWMRVSRWTQGWSMVTGIMTFLLFCGASLVGEEATPSTPKIARLPEKSIKVDGDISDWKVWGDQLLGNKADSTAENLLSYRWIERGTFRGPSDNALSAILAHDNENLYVMAQVVDDILVNTTTDANPYEGDDFELFLEVAPSLNGSGQANSSPQYRQCIVVPGGARQGQARASLWKAEDFPGVEVATHRTSTGYDLEMKIPKKLFPAFESNPSINSIAFDITICDADSPGDDGTHPAIKQARSLFKPETHYQSSGGLTKAVLENAILQPTGKPAAAPQNQGVTEPARFSEKDPLAEVIDEKLSKNDVSDTAFIVNGMLFLNEKQETVPASLLSKAFTNEATAPEIRLTALWLAGQQKQTSLVNALTPLLKDKNVRIRIKAAKALGMIDDKSVVPLLEKMASDDPHEYGRIVAAAVLVELKK